MRNAESGKCNNMECVAAAKINAVTASSVGSLNELSRNLKIDLKIICTCATQLRCYVVPSYCVYAALYIFFQVHRAWRTERHARDSIPDQSRNTSSRFQFVHYEYAVHKRKMSTNHTSRNMYCNTLEQSITDRADSFIAFVLASFKSIRLSDSLLCKSVDHLIDWFDSCI